MQHSISVLDLGLMDFISSYNMMREFTLDSSNTEINQIWLTEHPATYTQGLAGKPEHLLKDNNIPVIQTDRGGQITYHGPGQIIYYLLLNLNQLKLNVRSLVTIIEQTVIEYLDNLGIQATSNPAAPGVYVAGNKIASIGLRVRKGRCYHGFSFNYAVAVKPFMDINVCGYAGLRIVNLADLRDNVPLEHVKYGISRLLTEKLNENRN